MEKKYYWAYTLLFEFLLIIKVILWSHRLVYILHVFILAFEQYKRNELGLLNKHSEKMPDAVKTGNITLLSSCYPPIVNNHHFGNCYLITVLMVQC